MSVIAFFQQHRADILAIVRRYGVKAVYVFGSMARGDEREGSDVDLLVRYDPGMTLLREAAMIRELETLLGRHVDVVSERGMRPRVRERVLREAVPL